MGETAEDLQEHEDRLDTIEDRLSTAFPTPDTKVGAAQRFRFQVPTPATAVTFGARGANATDGPEIGPGGIALRTVENLAAEILTNTIIDTAGVTTIHSDGPARLLTLADLGVSGDAGVRVGTQEGDVELTAGHVGHPDPSFTVIPSMDVPDVATVDTAGPRGATETSRDVWGAVWTGIKAAETIPFFASWFTSYIDPPGGYSAPSIEPHAASQVQEAMVAVGVLRGLVVPAIQAAISAAEAASGAPSSSEPKVLIHGAGGVEVSSPAKTRMFGVGSATVESPQSAKLSGGLSAGVQSPVKAKVYGGLMAALKSEQVAKVSARFAVMSGEFAEVKGKEAAALSSGGTTTVTSAQSAVIDAPTVAIGARSLVDISSGQRTRISSVRELDLSAQERFRVAVGPSQVTMESDGLVIAHESTCIDVSDSDGIRLSPSGGGNHVRVDREGMRGRLFRFTRSEVTLRGQIRLG